MHRLTNPKRGYDWGSPTAIPEFLGEDPAELPVAEMWMGTHPVAPSSVDLDGIATDLSEVAGELPFLVKLLAASHPLSIQVHPGQSLAQAGFVREEAAGIALDARERIYKDPNAKPEMVFALTAFESLVGFRPTAEILRVLWGLDTPLTRRLSDELRATPGFNGIVRMLALLLDDAAPVDADEIHGVVVACRLALEHGRDIRRAYLTAIEVSEHFPDDVGTVVSLLLNRMTLQAGEAAFLGPGIIHAHLSGLCLEVMGNSDNVMRAGLTSKHIDRAGMLGCLDVGMSRVARVTPHQFGFSTEVFTPDVEEFALAVTQCSPIDVNGVALPGSGDRMLICIGGTVDVRNARGESVPLARGESLYASANDGALLAHGIGELALAFVPLDIAEHIDWPSGDLHDLV